MFVNTEILPNLYCYLNKHYDNRKLQQLLIRGFNYKVMGFLIYLPFQYLELAGQPTRTQRIKTQLNVV